MSPRQVGYGVGGEGRRQANLEDTSDGGQRWAEWTGPGQRELVAPWMDHRAGREG